MKIVFSETFNVYHNLSMRKDQTDGLVYQNTKLFKCVLTEDLCASSITVFVEKPPFCFFVFLFIRAKLADCGWGLVRGGCD